MWIDPGIVTFYFWVHVILLGIIGGIWFYNLPSDDEDDNRPTPKDEDDGWPSWNGD